MNRLRKEVILSKEALSMILAESSKYPDVETGGILLGYYKKGKAVVTRATRGGSKAKRSRLHFRLDEKFANAEIVRAWRETHGRIYYLGEWHKHPLSILQASSTDKRSMEQISLDRKLHCREPILIIHFSVSNRNGKIDYSNNTYWYDRPKRRLQEARLNFR
jgi:integrative and conjugative element protein (TIGR02256 family)